MAAPNIPAMNPVKLFKHGTTPMDAVQMSEDLAHDAERNNNCVIVVAPRSLHIAKMRDLLGCMNVPLSTLGLFFMTFPEFISVTEIQDAVEVVRTKYPQFMRSTIMTPVRRASGKYEWIEYGVWKRNCNRQCPA